MKTLPPDSHQRTMPSRDGFTLIEVLMALALCTVVLSAAFSAVHLSWKYRSAGSQQVERSQIVRGVFQDMSLDLRSAARFPDAPTAANQLASLPGMTPELMAIFEGLAQQEDRPQQDTQFEELSKIEERFLQFDSVGLVDPMYFFGDGDFFVMLSDSDNYRFAGSSVSKPQTVTQQHVVWFSNSGRSLRIPFGVSNEKLQFTTFNAPANQRGLLRMTQSFDVRTAESNQTTTGDWMQIIPETTFAEFRYSDGIEWQSTWNSHEQKRCPTAVEITLRPESANADDAERFVIRLPLQTGDVR